MSRYRVTMLAQPLRRPIELGIKLVQPAPEQIEIVEAGTSIPLIFTWTDPEVWDGQTEIGIYQLDDLETTFIATANKGTLTYLWEPSGEGNPGETPTVSVNGTVASVSKTDPETQWEAGLLSITATSGAETAIVTLTIMGLT